MTEENLTKKMKRLSHGVKQKFDKVHTFLLAFIGEILKYSYTSI